MSRIKAPARRPCSCGRGVILTPKGRVCKKCRVDAYKALQDTICKRRIQENRGKGDA